MQGAPWCSLIPKRHAMELHLSQSTCNHRVYLSVFACRRPKLPYATRLELQDPVSHVRKYPDAQPSPPQISISATV